MSVDDLTVKVGADISDFTAQFAAMHAALDRMSSATVSAGDKVGTAWKGMGDGVTKAGAAMTLTLTPLGVAIGLLAEKSTKVAIEFEASFASVKKSIQATSAEYKDLENQFRALAQTIPETAENINKLAAQGGQLGIAKENIVEFVKTVAMMGTTTNLSAEQAGEAFARIANIMGLSQADFMKMGSTIFDLGNKSAATEREITEMALRIAGAGKTLGMDTATVLSFAAALASVGIRAEMGGSAISRLMMMMATTADHVGMSMEQMEQVTGKHGKALENLFNKTQDQISGFARLMGVSVEDFARIMKEKPAEGITMFLSGLQKMQQAGGPVFDTLQMLDIKSVQLRDAVLRAASAGDLMTTTLKTGQSAWQENTALAEGAAQRYGTVKASMEIFEHKLHDIEITLGQAFLPMMIKAIDLATPFVQAIADGAKAFSQLDPSVQAATAAVVGLATVVGPVLIVIGKMISAVTAMPVLWAALTGPIGAVVAALIGVTAAVAVVVENWTQIKAVSQMIWDDIVNYLSNKVDQIKGVWEQMKGNAITNWTMLKVAVVQTAQALYQGVTDWIVTKLTDAMNRVKQPIETVKNLFAGLYDAVVGHSYIPDMVDQTGEHMQRLGPLMTNPARAATRATAAEFFNLAGVTERSMQELSSAAIFTWGSIRTGFVNSMVDMMTGQNTFQKFLQQSYKTILASVLNVLIEMGVQWAIKTLFFTGEQAKQATAHAAMETTKTTVTATEEAARVAITEAANKVILGGVMTTLASIGAVGNAAMATMAAVVAATAGVLEAIAAALAASIVGAEMAPAFAEAAGAVTFGGGMAVGAGTGAIQEALGTAIGAVSGMMATPFASGGIVTSPTFALIGEAGPEAVIPLRQMNQGGGEITIHTHVNLNDREIALAVMRVLPREVRYRTGAAL